MGCAPVTDDGVMYGFTNIPKENIKLMGATDINTYSRSFSYSSASRKYMSSKTMPYTSRRVYNEFGIERDGTIPDYVILFDDMNDNVMKNSYRASMQFGIPILQVDKKDIEAQQLESLRTKLEEYKQTNNPDLLGNIINTYETNIAGWLLNRSDIKKDKTYTSEINNSRFLADFKKLWGEIESEINNYLENLKASPNIDNNLGELTKIVEIFLHEHDLYEHTEETKPISKTKLSFNPAKILEQTNKHIFYDSKKGMFVTCFWAIVDTKNKSITYSNAGHIPQYFIKKLAMNKAEYLTEMYVPGKPLGFVENASYKNKKISYSKADKIIMFTDGVTETFNKDNEEFGESKLKDILKNEYDSSKELLNDIVEETVYFRADAPQFDDITLLIAKFL